MKPDLNTIQEQGLISAENLATILAATDDKYNNVVILDTTFVLPTSEENPKENYLLERIPGARFFNIKKICNTASPLPHTVPTKEQFDEGMSKLGLTNNDFIITYGQHGIAMGPCRVWWMLRLFGHNNVAVLDGGFPRWKKLGYATETGTPAELTRSSYNSAAMNSEKLTLKEHVIDVIDASEGKNTCIIDARPKARFDGSQKEPRTGMRSGHIPGSVSCPSSSLINPETHEMKGKPELKEILLPLITNKSPDQSPRIITTCGSGITACLIALALFRIEYENVSVYDGSWSEWGLENAGTPVACNT